DACILRWSGYIRRITLVFIHFHTLQYDSAHHFCNKKITKKDNFKTKTIQPIDIKRKTNSGH
ncbi:MAG: hypothetical protein ACI9LM_004671, partial [Alteromonadaceae bacterium]